MHEAGIKIRFIQKTRPGLVYSLYSVFLRLLDFLLLMAQTWNDVYFCILRVFSNYCRFRTSGLPTDIIIEVGEVSFHLHKVNLTRPKQISLVEVQ